MFETLVCRRAVGGVDFQHGQEEAGDFLAVPRAEAVLLGQDLLQRPRLQIRYISQVTSLIEELVGELARGVDRPGEGAHQLRDECEVVLVPRPLAVRFTLRVKQIVA